MKKNATIVLCMLAASVAATSDAAPGPRGKRATAEVAQKIIAQSAGVREGDVVVIDGSSRDQQLLEDLAIAARKAGAHPLVTLSSDRLTRLSFDEVPEKFDAQAPKLDLAIAELVDVSVSIDSNDDPTLLRHVAPQRFATRAKAFEPVMNKFDQRGVRRVQLGNGLYPTASRAKELGLPQAELEKLFWEAIDVDYAAMSRTGEAIKSIYQTGGEARLTNPNGTDVKFKLVKGKAFVSDGVISDAERSSGGAATLVWLPAGEAYAPVVPGSAEGKIVFERFDFEGAPVVGLQVEIKSGRVTGLSAKSGVERLRARYEAANPGRDEVSAIDVGLNPRARAAKGGKLQSYIPAGTVTIAVGNNAWAGGENRTNFGLTAHLPGSTLVVDGKAVVDKGELQVASPATATTQP